MNLEGLRDAVEAVATATAARHAALRAAWEALKQAEPQLADEIGSMWPSDDVAASWVCDPLVGGLSPVEMVMAGRTDLVWSIIRKAEYGFCA